MTGPPAPDTTPRTPPRINVLALSWAIDKHSMAMADEPIHDEGTCSTDCAGDIAARYNREIARDTEDGSLDALSLQVAVPFQDHHPRGEYACECGWRPNIGEPSTTHHEHLMLQVIEAVAPEETDGNG